MLNILINTLREKYHQKSGLKCLAHSKFQQALQHFERALVYHASTENYYYYAIILISLHKHQEAIPFLEKILHNHEDSLLIVISLAECFLVTREWGKAEMFLEYYYAKNKENLLLKKMYLIAYDVSLREKYAESKEFYFLALEFLEKKDYLVALLNIEKALELDELNTTYLYLASVLMIKAKKPKEEIAPYLEKAVLFARENDKYKKQLHYLKTRYKY